MAMAMDIRRAAGVVSSKDFASYATKDNLIDASKAVHDSIKDVMDKRLGQMESLVKSVESTVMVNLGMKMGKSFDEFAKKNVETYFNKQLEAIQKDFDYRAKMLEDKYNEKLSFIQQAYQDAMERMESFISRLQIPAPVINVEMPEHPINVHPSEVNPVFNVPEQAPPVVNVHSSQVNPVFNVPEQAPPVVNVQPRKGKIVKDISYDEMGRPVHIEEREES